MLINPFDDYPWGLYGFLDKAMDLQRNLIFDLSRGIAFMGLAWAVCVGVDPQRNGSSYLSKKNGSK